MKFQCVTSAGSFKRIINFFFFFNTFIEKPIAYLQQCIKKEINNKNCKMQNPKIKPKGMIDIKGNCVKAVSTYMQVKAESNNCIELVLAKHFVLLYAA